MNLRPLLAALLLLPLAGCALPRRPSPPTMSAPASEAFAVAVCREFVRAQLAHVQEDRDADGVREYAQGFFEARGRGDALYSRSAPPAEASALALLLAHSKGPRASAGGYTFTILTRQGAHARGGVQDYLVNTHLSGGFALLAAPTHYGVTGRRTFVVNQSGRVLQTDLGPDTAKLARRLTSYDPDASWAPAKR